MSADPSFGAWYGPSRQEKRAGTRHHRKTQAARRHQREDQAQYGHSYGSARAPGDRYLNEPAGYAIDGGHEQTAPRRGRNARHARAAASQTNYGGGFSSNLVSEARRYLGGNPTGRSSLWCGAFMDMILRRTGHPGGGNLARGYASYGTRVSGPQVGAIAVMSRGKRGGHVGVVSGIDANGNPIIISGNHGRRVAEATYPRGRIYAYVMP
jgi:uncharacterized protein (TIGR02594 family)